MKTDTKPEKKVIEPLTPNRLWIHADVEIRVTERIVGGVPRAIPAVLGWIQKNMPALSPEAAEKLATSTLEEIPELPPEINRFGWITFKKDPVGVYYEGRCMKAAFKEGANILREMLVAHDKKASGEASKSKFNSLKAKIAERLFVDDSRIHLYRDGQPIKEVDGTEERAIHVMTPQGNRDALKRSDYVLVPTLKFHIRYLADGLITPGLINQFLEYMGHNGIGADRSQGEGKFTVVSFTEVDRG